MPQIASPPLEILTGKMIVRLRENKLIYKIEWTWFCLWHHEGAGHGASMMAPDHAHWHGIAEVEDRFYQQPIPEALELASHSEEEGRPEPGKAVCATIDELLARPEHQWYRAHREPPKPDEKADDAVK